jgi:predicted O-methyltransferase YrrM
MPKYRNSIPNFGTEAATLPDLYHAYRYIAHRLGARQRQGRGVHPPFAYHFIREVFFGGDVPGTDMVEGIRRDMLGDRRRVEVEDIGAGSRNTRDRWRSVRDLARHTAVPPAYGHALARMVRFLKPPRIIELGTGTGMASLYMHCGCPSASLVTCEGSPAIAGIAASNFKKAGAAGITLRTGRFEDLLPGLLEKQAEGSMLFIDGDHRQESLLHYGSAALASGLQRQVIVMDDINWSPGMRKSWEFLRRHADISVSIETFRLGILITGKEIQNGHYRINYYP